MVLMLPRLSLLFSKVNSLHSASPLDFGEWLHNFFRSNMLRRGEISSVSKNKNDDSVVLKFQFNNCSAVLPGDAEKYTTDYIRSAVYGRGGRRNQEEVTVLMASHHGAMSHGANDLSWIRASNPKIGVFSAGDFRRLDHPKCYTVGSFLDPQDSKGFRSIWMLDKEKGYDNPSTCFASGSSRMQPVSLKYRALFNTFDVGDVTVVFRKEADERDDSASDSSYVCLHADGDRKIISGTSCSFGMRALPSGGGAFSSPQKPFVRLRLSQTV